MARAFSSPQHLQGGFRLSQLPAEIRLILLRELLLFPDCSEANLSLREYWHYWSNYKAERCQILKTGSFAPYLHDIKHKIRASLNLAWSCQLLYVDGLHVVYSENVLRLILTTTSIVTSLPAVAGRLNLVRQQPCNLSPEMSLENVQIDWKGFVYDGVHYDSGKTAVDVFHKFKNITVALRPFHLSHQPDQRRSNLARWIARTYRHSSHILSSKNFELKILEEWQLDPHSEPSLLLGCKILKLESFTVNCRPAPEYVNKYVTDREEMQDTYKDWKILWSQVLVHISGDAIATIDHLGVTGDATFRQTFEDKPLRLKELAWQYDSVAVSNYIKNLLREAKRWIDAWTELQMHKLAKRRKAVTQNIDQTNEQLRASFRKESHHGLPDTYLTEFPDGPVYTYSWNE